MKIGFTASAFDLLHPGHLLMLSEAKEHCDYLIVGLHTDPTIDRPDKNKPIQTTLERWIQLKNTGLVDDIIPYDTEEDLLNLLKTVKIDVRVIGEEYRGTEFTGHDLDMEIYYNKREHSWSSSELRRRIKDGK